MPVIAKKADLTKMHNVQVIVNAANGYGIMGRGIAGAIVRAAGPKFKDYVYEFCQTEGSFVQGDVYITDSGDLAKIGIEKVYHAVTMTRPGGPTDYNAVSRVFRKTLDTAVANKIQSIGVTGLGTGVGGLDSTVVAQLMTKIALEYTDKLKIYLVDIDDNFVDEAKKMLGA